MRITRPFIAVVALAMAGLSGQAVQAGISSASPPQVAAAATGTVVFGAGGDFGSNANTDKVMKKADTFGASFFLALGDYDYDQTSPDSAWCTRVKNDMPLTFAANAAFPFELVSGNHEDDAMRDGYIENFTAGPTCFPDRLNSTKGPGSIYGAEYYVDYPATNPMVRSIMLSPGLTIRGIKYSYTSGTHLTWLTNAIDSARAAGIPWIVVGAHYPCVTSGTLTCGMTQPLFKMLVSKKVDLVLQGHNHIYERTKQFATSSACPVFSTRTYKAACVVDSDNTLAKGAGTVAMTLGATGMTMGSVKPSDGEWNYFAATNDTTFGVTKFTASPTKMTVNFVPAVGTFTDSFTIGN